MQLSADGHVHVYPRYDLARFFAAALRGLAADSTTPVLLLTERSDCFFFQGLFAMTAALPAGFSLAERGPNSVKIAGPDGAAVIFVAGRQIVTAERLELLVLGRDLVIKDGTPMEQAIGVANTMGALPVVPWSPGKWLGARGKVVDRLISSCRPAELAFGDSALRPAGWPVPKLLEKAADAGFLILAGTDPLPLANEEERVGTYYTAVDLPALSKDAALAAVEAGLFSLLKDPQTAAKHLRPEGRRLSPAALLVALFRLKFAK